MGVEASPRELWRRLSITAKKSQRRHRPLGLRCAAERTSNLPMTLPTILSNTSLSACIMLSLALAHQGRSRLS
jgi:hypothetical protein